MTVITQSSHNFPLPYPLEESISSQYEKLKVNDIPQQFIGNRMFEFLYPHVRADQVAYMSGVTKEKWDHFYKSIFIMCCEFNLSNIIIIWSPNIIVRIYIDNFNWKQHFPLHQNFRESLVYEYNIGFCVGLVGNSVRKTIEMNPYPVPYQMYLNASHSSKMIPNFNDLVVPAFEITKDKSIFAHSCNSINLCRFNEIDYIKKALCHATANGMKGVVFHCGSSVNDPLPQCLQMLANNIVSGIRASMFFQGQTGSAKFILETPAGKGNEVLTDYNDFVNFCTYIKTQFPDVAPLFSVCVDTCHVHQCGYAPHIYLEEINKIHPVEFVHFNDSSNSWCCRKDDHARPGEGHIPWIFLLMVAMFCKNNQIPSVFEN